MRPDPAQLNDIAQVRAGIDAIDHELLDLLAERLAHVDRVGALKHRDGVSAAAPTRQRIVLDTVRARAADAGFDPDIAEAMWQVMLDRLVIRQQHTLGTDGRDA